MNLAPIEEIIALMKEYPVSEISIESAGRKISMRNSAAAIAAQTAALAPPPIEIIAASSEPLVSESRTVEALLEETIIVQALMVGVFHHLTPPITLGSVITPGQIVGNIESIKVMNEVLTSSGGRVVEMLIEDASPVDYGRALFRLAPEV